MVVLFPILEIAILELTSFQKKTQVDRDIPKSSLSHPQVIPKSYQIWYNLIQSDPIWSNLFLMSSLSQY